MAFTDNVIAAHGLIMAIAFVILYPTGALIIRLLNVRGTLWIHAAWQVFAYLCVLAGLGMGAWIATNGDEVRLPYSSNASPTSGGSEQCPNIK